MARTVGGRKSETTFAEGTKKTNGSPYLAHFGALFRSKTKEPHERLFCVFQAFVFGRGEPRSTKSAACARFAGSRCRPVDAAAGKRWDQLVGFALQARARLGRGGDDARRVR